MWRSRMRLVYYFRYEEHMLLKLRQISDSEFPRVSNFEGYCI